MGWKGNSKLNGYIYPPTEIEDHVFRNETNEQLMEVIETYCKVFSCGKKLSLIETLLGNKCIEHSQIKPLKISNGDVVSSLK